MGFLLLLTLALSVFAGASVLDRSLFSLMALSIAIIVSAFVTRIPLRIPGSAAVLPLPILFSFWGVLWCGEAGGLILGLSSTVFAVWPSRKQRNINLAEAVGMIASITISIFVFSFLFGSAAGAGPRPSGLDLYIVKLITAGSVCVAGIYVLTKCAFGIGLDLLDNYDRSSRPMTIGVREQALGGILTASATILACLPFSHFGIEFGLVIAPIAILANLAYNIHIKRLDQKTKQISEASRIHLATVEALATAIDARDQVGLGHVQRTQIYAIGIGQILGLGESDINALRTGALLHDIGKLAVPDHILNKPEKLTSAELEKTKIHALVGSSILDKIGFGYPVVPTVKHHHESWDGTGYPDGLKGTQIPLTARILSVADAYDTLRGARPYRPAIPRDLARQIIQDEAGTRFDPAIVRCFIKNLNQFEREIESNGLSYRFDDNFKADSENGKQHYAAQIKLANREVFTLYELAREFSASANFQETLGLFTKKIREFVPFTTCAVFLLDEKKKYAEAVHVAGEDASVLTSKRIKIGEGITGLALKTKESVLNGDPNLDLELFHLDLAEDYSTMASVPLIANEELIGAVSIYSRNTTGYGEEHLRLLETIARIAAEAIDKSIEHDEAKTNALTDPMTGLPNARSLRIQFEKEGGRASRAGSTLQVLMLDLDGFKAVNDSFGHKIGDAMLTEVSTVIREQLRDYDFLARYGGDEFVALIPDTNLEDVIDLCQRIETGVANCKLQVQDGAYASVGVSIGSASYPDQGETFDQMIAAADKAMYRRKTRRRLNPDELSISGVNLKLSAPGLSPDANTDGLIVELDETHVMASSAVN